MSSPTDSAAAAEAPSDAETPQQADTQRMRAFEVVGKKKKKNRGRAKAVKKRGTGFEEYYCDAPLTPAEYEEEREVFYPAYRPFVSRIQDCIQRFRATRHMDNARNLAFSRYLILGGVDAYPRQFQGLSGMKKDDLGYRTKAEMRTIAADDVIQRGEADKADPRFYNPNDPEHWEVDFAGVVAGYFSDDFNHDSGSLEAYILGSEVVKNFLKYVERHDVCPEYAADIRKALQICDLAVEEKRLLMDLVTALPGSFNNAATVMFTGNEEKSPFEFDNYGQFNGLGGSLDEDKARLIFGVNIAMQLKLEQGKRIAAALEEKTLTVTETEDMTLEVIEISYPDQERRSKYSAANRCLAGELEIEPCGSVTLRSTSIKDGKDTSDADAVLGVATNDMEVTFFLEKSILKLLKIGMKLRVKVCTLNEGIRFIKALKAVYPTYYTFLPQQLMLNYKEPTPYNRRAPNVHDYDEDGRLKGPEQEDENVIEE